MLNPFKKRKPDGKAFAISAEKIHRLVEPMGYCIATDKITCAGEPVGWMYRQQPDNDQDSGWRFFSGTETDQYIDNPENSELYDVNTIANYDPDIIPLLDNPASSAFTRDTNTSPLRPADPPIELD